MQSFRTELENPLVEKDIIELEKKIFQFNNGTINNEKFRSLRLARGIYGQRQTGVQMIRIKIPYGKLTTKQLLKIADISDEYSTGKLHLTTRQDIQIHFVSLDKTPELWAKLEQDDITLREACGNTVRNITASATAGIDANEPFDVSPYADAMFRYFLRNPVGQELGRKIKIAFAAGDNDNALTFIHDLGFVPKVLIREGREIRGFKVVIGGGLGAQPIPAETAYEFLEEEKIIPFAEAVIRVFDRYGERNNRNKARLKYLIQKLGIETFLELVKQEQYALPEKLCSVNTRESTVFSEEKKTNQVFTTFKVIHNDDYIKWRNSNIIKQKQPGYVAVFIRVPLGNITTKTARHFAAVVKLYANDDIRITINQSLLIRFVREESIPALYSELKNIGLSLPGAGSTIDVTGCPGTDTCNLGISNSTRAALAFEQLMAEEFPELIYNNDIKIKISGCMNSCSQHGMAQIGFHGSSLKVGAKVLPALQLLLGGGNIGNGKGRIAEKIIKFPSKRGVAVLRTLLNEYKFNAIEGESFNSFYDRKGKNHFYQLLKPLADTATVANDEYFDWGQKETFTTAIGVGECAGVVIDLVETLLLEAEEKLSLAEEALHNQAFSDSIYHSYSVFISNAKALLLDKQINGNSQIMIIEEFEKSFANETVLAKNFKERVLAINKELPKKGFAEKYFNEAKTFSFEAKKIRINNMQAV